MEKIQNETAAAIDVGSNSLRLMIAQINAKGTIIPLEDLSQKTHIGRDTFSFGKISTESIHETIGTLKGFARSMQDYGIKNYKAVSTSGIREAANRDFVLDQIKIKTGLNVEIINNSEERFFMLKAIRDLLPDPLKMKKEGTLIVDIGSGGVELSVFSEGRMQLNEYIKVGYLRLREVLSDMEKLTLDFPNLLEEFVYSRIEIFSNIIEDLEIRHFIGLGGELGNICRLINMNGEACEATNGYAQGRTIRKTELSEFCSKLHKMSTEQIVSEFGLNRSDAEILLPSVIIFDRFLKMTKAIELFAPMVSLRHGVLADMADNMFLLPGRLEAINDIISSVSFIAGKYMSKGSHNDNVTETALSIYDQTRRIHRLGERERLYLHIAAILHDVGKFISLGSHGFHSYNIARHQNITGLSNREHEIVANITRYHAEESPESSHNNYISLVSEDRIVVSKLSAILKLAEMLDLSHKQKVREINISASGQELVFRIKSPDDILLETWNFNKYAFYFEEVMNIKPVIKHIGFA